MKIDYNAMNAMTEIEQIAAVRKNGYLIKHIKNPSEVVCLAAVNQNWGATGSIENPSEAVCMAAVGRSGQAIYYIKNPSEAVQIQAVKSNPKAIEYITDSFTNTSAAIHFIYHPLYPNTPKEFLDRAPEILEEYCSGLGDVYIIGLSVAMTREELSKTMIEWAKSQQEAFHP